MYTWKRGLHRKNSEVYLSQLGVGEKAFLDIFEKGVTGNIGNDPAVGKNDRNIIRELYQAAWE